MIQKRDQLGPLGEEATVRLDKLQFGHPAEFKASSADGIAWTKEVLKKVGQKYDENQANSVDEESPRGTLDVDFQLKRMQFPEFGNTLLVDGEVKVVYLTFCTKCLCDVDKELFLPVKVAFLDQQYENSEWFQEQFSYYFENSEYEVYFFQKGKVLLDDFVYEQIVLAQDPFPLHDPNCLGLCQTCGEDRNLGNCSHQ